VVLSTLSKPSAPTLLAGRSLTPALLAFMLCIILAVALAHILEGIRQARIRRESAISWRPPNGAIALPEFEPATADARVAAEPRRRAAG